MNEIKASAGNAPDIQSLLGQINEKITKLDKEKQQLIEKKKAQQQDLLSASKKMGWREKIGGVLGGDKALIQKVESINGQVRKTKKEIKSIDQQISKLTTQSTDKLKAYLTVNDPHYTELVSKRKIHFDLYKSSKHYNELVKKAHQGVTDALLFASWEQLINHPEAKEKLDGFQKETGKYQVVVDLFDKEVADKPFARVDFPDLIKFSNEQVAMASFQKIAKYSGNYRKYADKYLTQSKKDILAYRQKVRDEMLSK